MNTLFKNSCIQALLVLLSVTGAYAQQQFTPKKASEALNSSYPELNPVLSPDGNELYFVRANHPENKFGETDSEDIWYSKKGEDGEWSEAVHVAALNISRYNAVWAVTADGASLLVHGRYNKKGTAWKKRGFSIVKRTVADTWGRPEPVKVAKLARKDKGLYTMAYLTPDGKHLMMSFSKRYNSKRSDLFVSTLKENGKYSRPKKLKMPLGDTERSPFVSADGKQLYYTSDIFGSFDIFVSERLDDSWRRWSEPTPVTAVNTNSWEAYFKTNATGSVAWYSARKDDGDPDLYTLKLYEENPFIVVSGRILNKQTNEPINNLDGFNIQANDTLQSQLRVMADGTYSLRLPLGKNYQLSPELAHHAAEISTIEAEGLYEYAETTADLYLSPWKVVQVKGRLLERKNQTAIPVQADPEILVNGQAPDSLKFNATSGEYELWLPFGKNYKIKAMAKGHKAVEVPLQLAHIKAYESINKDLLIDKAHMATVQGRLLDRKTGERFPLGIPIKVMLNDTLQLAVVDSLGTYEITLPLRENYILSAKADGYYPITELIELRQEDKSVKVYKDLYLAPVEVGQSIRLNNVFFETAKAALMPASYPELDRVVEFLKDNANMKIEIAGHTDNKGSAQLNTKLSANRADAVAKYIISKGIDKDRLTSKGYGSTRPEGDNATEAGRSINRRVEFTILEIKK